MYIGCYNLTYGIYTDTHEYKYQYIKVLDK